MNLFKCDQISTKIEYSKGNKTLCWENQITYDNLGTVIQIC